MDIKLNDDEVLVLVREYGNEENKLPESGLVESDEPIYGLLWGYGDYNEFSYNDRHFKRNRYILVKVLKSDLILYDINEPNTVKFLQGDVIYSGDWIDVITILQPYWLSGASKNIKINSTIGDNCPSYSYDDRVYSYTTGDHADSFTKGNSAHSTTAGDCSDSIATGENSYSMTSGWRSCAVATGSSAHCITTGDSSIAYASGDMNQAYTKGYASPSISHSYNCAHGNSSTEGDYSPSVTLGMPYAGIGKTSGNDSHAVILGNHGLVTTKGERSIACAFGDGSIARCGEEGVIVLTWVDENDKIRVKVGYPGEDGIKPNTYYQLDDEGNFVEYEGDNYF